MLDLPTSRAQIFSRARNASGRFFMFSAAKANQRAKPRLVSLAKNRINSRQFVWSAICFKVMTRYTCGFFPRILAIIPATRYTCVFCHVYLRFIPKYMTIFLQTRTYMRTKEPIYTRYKQACGIWVTERRHIRGTELYRQQKNPSCTMGLKSNFSFESSMAAMAAFISSKIWFLFIALTVVVVVGSPTTDLLQSVDCLLRDCVRYFTNADRNNDRFVMVTGLSGVQFGL